jgi:phycocyanobilin lyase beta subunit
MIDSTRTQNLIQAVERADSPARLVEAVRALAACHSREAIPTLIAVLGYNNPGAALAAAEALIELGEAAVMPLLEQLDEYDYGARAYSIRALAAIADPRALDVLVSAAIADFAPSVRRAAAKGLGKLRFEPLPAAQAHDAQEKALHALLQIAQDADWAIRYAAVVGLQALATEGPELKASIQEHLAQMLSAEADAAVRSRLLLAQQRLQGTNHVESD